MSGSNADHLPEPPEEVAAAIAIALSLALSDAPSTQERVSVWQRSTQIRPAWTSNYPDAWRAQTSANRSAYPE